MTLYREPTERERQDFINYGTPEIVVRAVIVAEPDLYVYLQGGMSRAFYQCDRSEADGAVFDINLFGDTDE